MRVSAVSVLVVLMLSGCASVPGLVEKLQHDDVRQRRLAARKLGLMQERAKEAAPALAGALKDQDPEVRLLAANSLGLVAGDTREVVPALLRMVEDPDEGVREAAVRPLGRILFRARETVLNRAGSGEEETRLFFSPLLGAAARGPVGELTELLKDGSARVRVAAAFALGCSGPDAGEAVPALARMARDDRSVGARLAAVWALWMQGPDAEEARTTLAELAEKNESPQVREHASELLSDLLKVETERGAP